MFLMSSEYMFMVEANRVVLYYGRVGSYKTLSAVATAFHLMKTGRFKRCYANIPVSFASSPPVPPAEFDFLDNNYASDSIYIIDESALFLSGRHEQIKEIFAFPRKINQVFLLASVLPTKQITDYAHLFVHRGYNLGMIGIPIIHFLSSTNYKTSQRKEKISHFLANPMRYYPKFNSKFRPESLHPIYQYRDSGILYDTFSRVVNPDITEYFFVDGWGQANRRKDLSPEESNYVNYYLPEYNTDDAIDEKNDFPRMKQKKSLRNLVTAEFNPMFVLQFLFIVYITITIIKFIGNTGKDEIPMTQWSTCDYAAVLQWRNHNECQRQAVNSDSGASEKYKPAIRNETEQTGTANETINAPNVVTYTIQ